MLGNIRRVDNVGRVTIPSDFRRYLGIELLDYVEIICEEDEIRIRLWKEDE